ncbi:hypothetical protein E9549_04080 [Blastococcus sp. MG754426]|nr:hypothetical protein [Blastococcus sp. MG754426]MCF6506590.1 hypothetical protein [Blastococcus sp. MG754426]
MSQSSLFGAGVHPDLPTSFVHFTGRPRGAGDRPPPFAADGAEGRLLQILQQGLLRAASTWGTTGPVVCVSESTENAIKVMLSTGVTTRGPYEPWALLLDRDALIERGFRPVWHMSEQSLQVTNHLPALFRDLRVRYQPGEADWLAEREWRLCWGDTPLEDGRVPALKLTGLLTGVIVGRRGWTPPSITIAEESVTTTPNGSITSTTTASMQFATSCDAVPRLWWNGEELVDDGVFDVNSQIVRELVRPWE